MWMRREFQPMTIKTITSPDDRYVIYVFADDVYIVHDVRRGKTHQVDLNGARQLAIAWYTDIEIINQVLG